MISEAFTRVEEAERLDWRCSNCVVRPLFARYTHIGGVHVRLAGRMHNELHYIYDLQNGAVKAHCPACHAWEELYFDRESSTVKSRKCEGPVPARLCSVCSHLLCTTDD